ncbi:hypothetical protein EJI00_23920 [Variovorax sp. DXTD-1]|nr:hypothetical protein EJI00_23920 [Variovorax sp. DXTD-1]
MRTRIELTQTARRHAAMHGIEVVLRALALDARAQVGDVVELDLPAGRNAFVIRARRWVVVADGEQTLVFELDHPPRH